MGDVGGRASLLTLGALVGACVRTRLGLNESRTVGIRMQLGVKGSYGDLQATFVSNGIGSSMRFDITRGGEIVHAEAVLYGREWAYSRCDGTSLDQESGGADIWRNDAARIYGSLDRDGLASREVARLGPERTSDTSYWLVKSSDSDSDGGQLLVDLSAFDVLGPTDPSPASSTRRINGPCHAAAEPFVMGALRVPSLGTRCSEMVWKGIQVVVVEEVAIGVAIHKDTYSLPRGAPVPILWERLSADARRGLTSLELPDFSGQRLEFDLAAGGDGDDRDF